MKIGATLVRENIKSAYDAINYFNQSRKKNKKMKTKNDDLENKTIDSEVKENIDEDLDYENFLKEMAD